MAVEIGDSDEAYECAVWLEEGEAELVAQETGLSCGKVEASEFGAEHRRTVRAPTTEFIIVYNGA